MKTSNNSQRNFNSRWLFCICINGYAKNVVADKQVTKHLNVLEKTIKINNQLEHYRKPKVIKNYARYLLKRDGFGFYEFQCLNTLWIRESNWRWNAKNKYSGAYGIPQSLPASKMATIGPDWKSNPKTQVRWGIKYIKSRYGTPCRALSASNKRVGTNPYSLKNSSPLVSKTGGDYSGSVTLHR